MPWVIGQLDCGCRRSLGYCEKQVEKPDGKGKVWVYTGEATQEFVGCIGHPMLPPERKDGQPKPNMQRLLWVALPGVNLHHFRCSDGTPPPLPSEFRTGMVRDAQGNPLTERDEVVVLGTGGHVRYMVQELQGDRILTTVGRRILPSTVVRSDRYVPLSFSSAS